MAKLLEVFPADLATYVKHLIALALLEEQRLFILNFKQILFHADRIYLLQPFFG